MKRKLAERRKKIKKPRKIYLMLPLLLLVILALVVFKATSTWGNKAKLNISVVTTEGVNIVGLNPQNGEVTVLEVPGDTLVEMSRNLGSTKIKNVWKIGFNEGHKGDLLAETVTKNFNIASFVWGEECLSKATEKEFFSLVKFVTIGCKSNIHFGDRVKMAMFLFGIDSSNIKHIKLESTGVLKKNILVDGTPGYEINRKLLMKELLVFASDPNFTSNAVKVEIQTAGSGRELAEDVGELVEMLGGKVALIREAEDIADACRFYAKHDYLIEFLPKLLKCKYDKTLGGSGFELIIKLGENFRNQY